MSIPIRNSKNVYRCNNGGALIEFSLVLPIILLPIFFAMVEIMDYINAKIRLDKVANQIADAMSKTPSRKVAKEDADNIINTAKLIMGEESTNIKVVLCEGDNTIMTAQSEAPGKCHPFDIEGVGGANSTVSCSTAGAAGRANMQYVVVGAACTYVPIINVYRHLQYGGKFFFSDPATIEAASVAPINGNI